MDGGAEKRGTSESEGLSVSYRKRVPSGSESWGRHTSTSALTKSPKTGGHGPVSGLTSVHWSPVAPFDWVLVRCRRFVRAKHPARPQSHRSCDFWVPCSTWSSLSHLSRRGFELPLSSSCFQPQLLPPS